jgi:DNA-binding MarR family transcriptional regulator
MLLVVTEVLDTRLLASELRVVLGALVRRLRAEYAFSLSQATVLGRLDRDGTHSISELAAAERVRPQSMAQTVSDLEASGLIARHPDPTDGRRTLVNLTESGHRALDRDRSQREGWLAQAIADELTDGEQQQLAGATPLLRRIADS